MKRFLLLFILVFNISHSFSSGSDDEHSTHISCGGKFFKVISINTYEMKITNNSWVDFPTEIIGVGGYRKWACVNFSGVNYLILDGTAEALNLDQSENISHCVTVYNVAQDQVLDNIYACDEKIIKNNKTIFLQEKIKDALFKFVQKTAKESGISKKIGRKNFYKEYSKIKFQKFNFE
jgi:hypothetical protein